MCIIHTNVKNEEISRIAVDSRENKDAHIDRVRPTHINIGLTSLPSNLRRKPHFQSVRRRSAEEDSFLALWHRRNEHLVRRQRYYIEMNSRLWP